MLDWGGVKRVLSGSLGRLYKGTPSICLSLGFFYGWIWFYFLVNAVLIRKVYYSVLRQEKKNDKYNSEGESRDRKRSRSVAHQAIWLLVAYYLTFLPGTTVRSMQLRGTPLTSLVLVWFAAYFPVRGLVNGLIYLTLPAWRRHKSNKRRK